MPPIVLAALIQIQLGGLPPPPARTTPDDCEIIVLAGKEVLGWGTGSPQYRLARFFNGAGAEIYQMDCPWKTLGVPPPEIGFNSRPMVSRFAPSRLEALPSRSLPGWDAEITRPIYTQANLFASVSVHLWQDGVLGPASKSWSCSFFKYYGKWDVSGCTPWPAQQQQPPR